jgi:hypothetical protein
MVDFYSALASGDAVFDVALTSNCMGAAVLIYQLVERLDTTFVEALCDLLHVNAQHPFGSGVGLIHLEHADWGKAVLRYGGREIRLTLLLRVPLHRRQVFERALVAAATKMTHAFLLECA